MSLYKHVMDNLHGDIGEEPILILEALLDKIEEKVQDVMVCGSWEFERGVTVDFERSKKYCVVGIDCDHKNVCFIQREWRNNIEITPELQSDFIDIPLADPECFNKVCSFLKGERDV